MNGRVLAAAAIFGAMSVTVTFSSSLTVPVSLAGVRAQDAKTMAVARGEFAVKLAAQQDGEPFAAGRRTIDKQFRGDIEGSSAGQMLSWLNAAGDSGGYVAIERVTGTLHGRQGSFVLQHSSTALRGAQQQHIIVVPGSGDGQLAGLTGTMTIAVKDGKHFYEFSYRLDP